RTRGERSTLLRSDEFIRRFLQHVLPQGFTKIRHYGLLAPRNASRLRLAQALLARRTPSPPLPTGWRELLHQLTGIDLAKCPRCGAKDMTQESLPVPDTPATANMYVA